MKTWSEYIADLKQKWIGKAVLFQGQQYIVVDIDYNGCLLIDKEHYYHETYTSPTTAIATYMIDPE